MKTSSHPLTLKWCWASNIFFDIELESQLQLFLRVIKISKFSCVPAYCLFDWYSSAQVWVVELDRSFCQTPNRIKVRLFPLYHKRTIWLNFRTYMHVCNGLKSYQVKILAQISGTVSLEKLQWKMIFLRINWLKTHHFLQSLAFHLFFPYHVQNRSCSKFHMLGGL